MRNQRLLSLLLNEVKPYRFKLIVAMLCMVFVAGLSALQAYMVKPLLDEIFFNKNEFMLSMLPIALIALFLVKGIFYYGYAFLMDYVGQSVVKNIRINLFSHIQSMQLSFFHKTSTGELISRVMNDVALIQNAISKALVGVLKDMFQVVGLIGVIFYQDWKLALMSLIFLPLAFFPIVSFGRKYRRLSIKSQKIRGVVSTILHESIAGNRIVKAFCMERIEIERFTKSIDKLFKTVIRDVKVRSLAHPLMELLGGFGIALIIFYGGKQVISGVSTPGTFFSFLAALIMIYDPIKQVSKVNNALQKGLAASGRIFEFLDQKPMIVDPPDAKELSPEIKMVEFENVGFSYDNSGKILSDLDLQVKSGQVLAIVGTSGSGKTTMVNLIPRFFDVTSGQICINGMDVRDMSLSSLRSRISVVTQETILFNDSVKRNISYGSRDCSDDEIRDAARSAHALKFINELPEGFDTIIGESGARLSGGQRQRISIARAILKNSPILILDEATSSLDTESELEVQKALDNLMKNRTTFVIAHRLSTIKYADRIIVLKQGKIVEKGSHEELLALGGEYQKLYTMQFGNENRVD
ncbi:MAG: ABC transporter ATP-binding protein/permease [Desulfobulbaceae bacterium]|nr:ABC transporter ATP-binding protein/permease [Desulfobulbaceae bacterium]